MLTAHIISLFGNSCECYFNKSIIKRAAESKRIKFEYYNPIDYSKKSGGRIDDRPYGGGPGMILEPEPFLKCFQKAKGRKKNVKTIFFSPSGKKFNTKMAESLSKCKHIIFLCGHYEGIDNRVAEITKAEVVSIGDYVLTGGELPAMVVIDSIARQIDGVLGNSLSLETKRVSSSKVYTRPEVLSWKGKKYKVPKVLLSGNHKDIEDWRKKS